MLKVMATLNYHTSLDCVMTDYVRLHGRLMVDVRESDMKKCVSPG